MHSRPMTTTSPASSSRAQLTRPDGSALRVLVVDDEPSICELLSMALRYEGWDVRTAHDGTDAVREAREFRPDAVVLDVMLPGMTGLDALSQIRAGWDLPVLMLSGRGEPLDRIIGLELGADDYLPKPAMPRELVARLRALLRRHQPRPRAAPETLRLAGVELDTGRRSVRCGTTPLNLTAAEFEMLRSFLSQPGDVISREALTEQALGRSLERYDRAVDVHVSRLRKKLTDAEAGLRIDTVRGAGYALV